MNIYPSHLAGIDLTAVERTYLLLATKKESTKHPEQQLLATYLAELVEEGHINLEEESGKLAIQTRESSFTRHRPYMTQTMQVIEGNQYELIPHIINNYPFDTLLEGKCYLTTTTNNSIEKFLGKGNVTANLTPQGKSLVDTLKSLKENLVAGTESGERFFLHFPSIDRHSHYMDHAAQLIEESKGVEDTEITELNRTYALQLINR